MQFKEGLAKAFFIACGVIVFVFMGYEHVVLMLDYMHDVL